MVLPFEPQDRGWEGAVVHRCWPEGTCSPALASHCPVLMGSMARQDCLWWVCGARQQGKGWRGCYSSLDQPLSPNFTTALDRADPGTGSRENAVPASTSFLVPADTSKIFHSEKYGLCCSYGGGRSVWHTGRAVSRAPSSGPHTSAHLLHAPTLGPVGSSSFSAC